MLTLASPWLLLLLPLPLLVYWLSPKHAAPLSSALKLPFFHALLPYLQQSETKPSQYWRPSMCLLSVIWLCLIIAAARPVYVGAAIITPSVAHNIMLAMDISGSMDIDDMQANGQSISRMQAIKAVANQFIRERQGDRLGLILFGSQAYLMTPITYDRTIVAHMLNDASVGLAGPQTAIGDAIGLAVKKLQAFPEDSRMMILLTDGVSNSGNIDPLVAAQLAKDYHVKIYTIGFGADRVAVPTLFGDEYVDPSADLDENTLKQIAKLTGGLYFRATSLTDLAQVYQAISQLEPVSANQPFRPQQELYAIPLAIALLLSLLLAWRVSGLSLILPRTWWASKQGKEIR